MKVVDLHPEDLIDKLSDHELTPAERERLDSHLAQCSACRFEISVRADLKQDAPLFEQRPQLTFAGQTAQRLQTSAELPAVAELGAPPARGTLRPRSRRRWPLVLLAASFILCAGGATAAVITGAVAAPAWLPWSPAAKATEATPHTADAKLSHKVKHALKVNVAAPVAVAAAVPSLAEALVVPEPSAQPAAALKKTPSPALAARAASPALLRPLHEAVVSSDGSARSAPLAPAVAAIPAAASPDVSAAVHASADPAAPHVDPAASLFADANRARRDGNVDRAVALYHSLQTRYPTSSESELSRALLAQLLLDRGSPEQALAGFDRYLAEGAPVLSAEALVGRARALEQLGKPEQAASAWKQVQSRFPGSVHARLAATRLAALGMR
jgi:TolA-binding protein